jgi:hypothetical protein
MSSDAVSGHIVKSSIGPALAVDGRAAGRQQDEFATSFAQRQVVEDPTRVA